jgi:glutamate-ammonia-ligase adenylyltransferase
METYRKDAMTTNLTPKDLIIAPELTTEQVESLLRNYGFRDLRRADRNLQNLADVPPLREAFAEIVDRLLRVAADSPDPDAALNNFERFAGVTFNRLWLYHLLRDAPFLLRILTACFSSSTYLSDVLVRNPEYFDEIIDAGVMGTPKTREMMYNELAQSVRLFRSTDQKLNALRRYKRKESLRIGLRDLLGDADIETTTLELANLAEATLQHCYEIGVAELTARWGTPLSETGEPSTFVVIGMGKFGGYELNFSSDIDVMFVYSDDGKTDQGIENNQFFTKLAEFIINGMSQVASAGYVFRVDARLRPESSVGVIIRSIDSYEAYYESWGEIWERQALIKARPVAGDMKLGRRFTQTLQPFVYQRYLDEFSIAEIKLDIRQTKARVERRLRQQGDDPERHVKLGVGAIRDVEFVIQCLQLIHGGPIPELRNRNSLETIELLHKHRLLSQADRDTLADAYRFLRAVEHRIQMEADLQRYSLPEKPLDLLKLARCMGYPDAEAFQADYARRTGAARKIFERILATPVPEGEIDIPLLLTTTETVVVSDLLSSFGFADVREAHRRLKLMAEGPEGVRFSPQVRRAFGAIAPILLRALREAPDPDMAIRYIEAFAGRVGARSAYYTLFFEKPSILELLAKLCGASRFLAELLIAHPESFDVLTVPSVMESAKTLSEMRVEASQTIEDLPADKIFTGLRQYKNGEVLRIGLRNILGLADLWATTAELSDLAEAVLNVMYAHIDATLKSEYGIPQDADGNEVGFAIIAMGKFGGRELNFSADLDLMYVYAAEGQTTKGLTNAEFFSKLGLELVNRLKGNTGGGAIYELDLRLRPFGPGGAIALSLEGYRNYYEKHAETWERQALIRARPAAGDKTLGERFIELAHAFAYSRPLTENEISQIVYTRRRKEEEATRLPSLSRRRRRKGKTLDVKSGYGGLVDIEFAAQTLQLIHGATRPQVRVQNTLEAIRRLHAIGALTENQRDELIGAYEFLRGVENSLRIVHDRPLHALPDSAAALEQLARRLGYTSQEQQASERFLNDYHRCTENTRALFNQLLGA